MRRTVMAVLVGITLVAGACGLPDDDSPRVISEEALPPDLTERPEATTTIPPELAEPREVFLVSQLPDDTLRLATTPRNVRSDADTETKIESILRSLVRRQEGDDRSLGTRVPPTLEIQDVDLDERLLTIDMSANLADVQGETQRLAFAQLVYTATQFDEVENVRFTIDGVEVNAVDGTGESQRLVNRASYANFAPLVGG